MPRTLELLSLPDDLLARCFQDLSLLQRCEAPTEGRADKQPAQPPPTPTADTCRRSAARPQAPGAAAHLPAAEPCGECAAAAAHRGVQLYNWR